MLSSSRPPTLPTSPTCSPSHYDFQGRKRVHNADEIMAEIVAKRLVEHLERAAGGGRRRGAWVGFEG